MELKREIKKLKKMQSNIVDILKEPFFPGGVNENYNVCGKPKCMCKDPDTPVKHGPYVHLSYTISKTGSSMSLDGSEERMAKEFTLRFQNLKKNINELAITYFKLFKDNRSIAMFDSLSLSDDGNESIGHSGLWKEKAIRRSHELESKKVNIRDLTESRDNWRKSVVHMKEDMKILCLRIHELEKDNAKMKKEALKKKLK
jgi:hypothetical protein